MPPKITMPPGTNVAEPGVFKSIHGMVRLVDLRVRFGVDEADYTRPGKIIIVEVEGGHAGFWVDEIEDVTEYPQAGWASVPAYIPRSVFTQTWVKDNTIRLYADFEKLDKFKASGYLRRHIEILKAAELEVLKEEAETKTISTNKVFKEKDLVDNSKKYKSEKNKTNISETEKIQLEDNYLSKQKIMEPTVERQTTLEKKSINKSQPNKHIDKVGSDSDLKTKINNSELHDSRLHNSSDRSTNAKDKYKGKVNRTDAVVKSNKKPNDNIANKKQPFTLNLSKTKHEKYTSKETKNTQITPLLHGSSNSNINFVMNRSENNNNEVKAEKSTFKWWLILIMGLLIYVISVLYSADFSIKRPKENKNKVALVDENIISSIDDPEVSNKEIAEYINIEHDNIYEAEKDNPQASLKTNNEVEKSNANISKTADGVLIVINKYVDSESNSNLLLEDEYKTESNSMVNEAVVKDTEEILETLPADALPHSKIDDVNIEDVAEAGSQLNDSRDNVVEMIVYNEKLNKVGAPITKTKENITIKGLEKNETPLPIKDKKIVQVKPASQKYVHVVIKGDTLWHIAKHYVNDPWRYPELAKLSRIDNPDLIYPGDKVIIIIHYHSRSAKP